MHKSRRFPGAIRALRNLRAIGAIPVLVLAMLVAPAHARDPNCAKADEREVAALFDLWNATLSIGEPAAVSALYAAGAVLLPTLSNQPRVTREEKEDYFRMFLALRPSGTIEFRRIRIDCDTAVDAGIYRFAFADGRNVRARYTFVYGREGGRWRITSHHSSAMPEPQ
jgi:uncharacterized protein (TIGR02246 family)